MTATERIRELLDERGVKYKYRDMFGKHVFHWGTPAVNGAMFTDGGKWTELVIENPTPEQAVEATLGRGTCRIEPFEMERDTGFFDTMQCECGHVADVADWAAWRFCPRCGREVVE